jgi:hypothetical protein
MFWSFPQKRIRIENDMRPYLTGMPANSETMEPGLFPQTNLDETHEILEFISLCLANAERKKDRALAQHFCFRVLMRDYAKNERHIRAFKSVAGRPGFVPCDSEEWNPNDLGRVHLGGRVFQGGTGVSATWRSD